MRKIAKLQTPSLSKDFARTFLLVLTSLTFFSGCCWFAQEELDKNESLDGSEKTVSTCTLREIEYFLDIALGAEYGTSEFIKRWSGTIEYQIKGSPTITDRMTIRAIMKELKQLTGNDIRFKRVGDDPEMVIWFVPVSDMPKYEPEYVEGNWGFFYIWWDGDKEIYKANILIGSDEPNQHERNHLIREEVTQSLGLINDSWKYEESIFYQGWTETQEFAEIDKKLIAMLYSDVIEPGMTRKGVMDALITAEESN